jgi:uncharacterized coiled-coil DUF342 family protein
MDELAESLEKKVDEHSIQIQELKDEVDFKKWKIDSLIEKVDNLTTVVQQIQLNQLKDDNDIKNRVIALESSQSTNKWWIGVALTGVGLIFAYIGLKGGI